MGSDDCEWPGWTGETQTHNVGSRSSKDWGVSAGKVGEVEGE